MSGLDVLVCTHLLLLPSGYSDCFGFLKVCGMIRLIHSGRFFADYGDTQPISLPKFLDRTRILYLGLHSTDASLSTLLLTTTPAESHLDIVLLLQEDVEPPRSLLHWQDNPLSDCSGSKIRRKRMKECMGSTYGP